MAVDVNRLALVVAMSVLLAGCSAPAPRPQAEFLGGPWAGTRKSANDLSGARMQELGDAFIGREFVLRAVWHEYAVVDADADLRNPCPFTHVTSRAGGTVVKVPMGFYERNQLVVAARPGETATITGLFFGKDRVTISSRKANDAPVFLTVTMPRKRTILFTKQGDCTERQKIDDENVSVAWLDQVLASSVLEFLAPAAPQVALPEPEQGLVLQAPGSGVRAATTVSLLSARAEPAQIRRGEMVRLAMTYSIGAAAGEQVTVDESYLLSFNGEPLPRFPIRRSEARAAGEHSGAYAQAIPRAAAPGTYQFKAEVCVSGTCSSRVSEFELVP